MNPEKPDLTRIDDAVLALLWLTATTAHARSEFSVTTSWKGHDWDALGRLHAKGLIGNPVDYTGLPDEGGDLILRGFCSTCGHVVVRRIEISASGPHALH